MIEQLGSGLLRPAIVQIQNLDLDLHTVVQRLGLLAWFAATLFLAWFTARSVYNIWFHPLSRFPGPWYAATTDLVQYVIAVHGDSVPWIIHLHSKYGEVVRVAPGRLSYIAPEAWRDVYGHRIGGRTRSVLKDHEFYNGPLNVGGETSIITEIDDVEHGRIRKIFSNAFSDKALRQQQHLLTAYADELVVLWRRSTEENKSADAVKMYNYATFDIMGDLTLGDHLGMLQSGTYVPWVAQVFATARAVLVFSILLRWRRVAWALGLVFGTIVDKGMRKHLGFVIDRVDARLARHSDTPDIWNMVLSKNEAAAKASAAGAGDEADGGGAAVLTRNAMYSNASVFMAAGTETLATTLSGLTYLLLKNPDKMAKLVAEIRAQPSEDALNLENLPRLKYLQACIDETTRIYPAVPIGLPRVVPDGGATICGEFLPAGTRVHLPHAAMYWSERNFKDATSFIPERWLPGSGYGDEDRKEAWQPFSYGPRNCIGKNLAYHELRLIASKVLWHFDLELCPESDDWMNQKTFNLWEKPALVIKAKSVERVAAV